MDMTRAAGEALLRDFIPRMGELYARERNFDLGPGLHQHVSRLSPYVRRRLVLEQDLVDAALNAHGPRRAEKFIQEVFWRGYFKGWLEQRPSIWHRYCEDLREDLKQIDTSAVLAARLNEAESGRTGLAYFDAWVNELISTGYLHNHARMWFASIWIFTLELPWRLGADFFFRHLLDGDPASNTLSWRWVAGLHTRGKAYEADAGNITRFTRHRFSPSLNELAKVGQGLEHTEPEGLPEYSPLPAAQAPDVTRASVLLITEEDCRLEDFDLSGLPIMGVATLASSHLRSVRAVSPGVVSAEKQALEDAAQRIGARCPAFQADKPSELMNWLVSRGAQQIVTPTIPRGPLRDWLDGFEAERRNAGIRLCELRRDWDRVVWPHANAGFFKVKQRIPGIVKALSGR